VVSRVVPFGPSMLTTAPATGPAADVTLPSTAPARASAKSTPVTSAVDRVAVRLVAPGYTVSGGAATEIV
jgi:hypothetical protein